jgi:O-antigen/teichoic acid export membrane protein
MESIQPEKKSNTKQSIARHTVNYAIGNISRQIAGFIMLPIYTRYLTPADYGAVSLLAFAMALLEPFFGARLAQAVPKFYFESDNEQSRRASLTSAITLTASVSAISALLIAVFSQPASSVLFGTTEYALATALFGLNILTQPIEHTGMMYIRLHERSTLFLIISLGKLFLQITLNLLFVIHMGMGVIGVILSGVIASTVIGVGLTGYVFYQKRPKFDRTITWKMILFCWPLWFAGIAGLYIGSSNRLFLRIFSSLDDVGLIELGTRFASIIGLLIWSPFSQHWETASFKYHKQQNAKQIFQTAFLSVSTLLVAAGLGVSIFSETIIKLMASEAFHDAAQTVPFLTLGFLLNSLGSFFYFSFMVTDKTKVFGYCHYFTAGIITVCYLTLIPKLGAVGAAAGQALAYAASLLFTYKISRRYYDPEIQLGNLVAILSVACATYVVTNHLLAQDDLLLDLITKFIIYLAACGFIVLIALHNAMKVDSSAVIAAKSRLKETIKRFRARETE